MPNIAGILGDVGELATLSDNPGAVSAAQGVLQGFVVGINPELGISLFEIAQSLFALERTFILGAMVLLETKSEA